MSAAPRVFVTVGSTCFEPLMQTLDTAPVQRALLQQLGCRQLVVQYGRGHTCPRPRLAGATQLQLEVFRYRDSLAADMAAADLVISHAGAGSCIEALEAGVRLLVVVNDSLMHNHQSELAERLAADSHCDITNVAELERVLGRLTPAHQLRPLPRGRPELLAQHLDACFGSA